MIPGARDIGHCFPHFNTCVPGYPEPAEIPAEEEGRAGETAANVRCSELQGHVLRRAGGLLQKLHQNLPGQPGQQGQVSVSFKDLSMSTVEGERGSGGDPQKLKNQDGDYLVVPHPVCASKSPEEY